MLLIGVIAHLRPSDARSDSEWKYEGRLDIPANSRLCYWAPFEFSDLENLEWYLALETSDECSCLLGTHPDAQSSLWQISPDGDLWLKRQGSELALVEEVAPNQWEVTRTVPFPSDLQNPANAIIWATSTDITVLENGVIWNMNEGSDWKRMNDANFNMSGFVERGFVQSQSFIYYWGVDAGLLIHKRTGRIQRFLNDNWPDLLLEFEQLGTVWRVEGDEVSVRNSDNELVFNLGQKALLTNDLLFNGIHVQGPSLSKRKKTDSLIRWRSFDLNDSIGYFLLVFLLGAGAGASGLQLFHKKSSSRRLEESGRVSSTDMQSLNELQLSGLSKPFQALVMAAPGMLSTEEFDMVIGNDIEQSPESQRSRRSKAIREVNNEAQLVIGYELVERDRDALDRRKVTYRIKTVPKRLIRQIERQRIDKQGLRMGMKQEN
jgi:hypothetical protein